MVVSEIFLHLKNTFSHVLTGVQAIAKLDDMAILVEVSCLEGKESDYLHLRSKIIEAILQVKQKALGASEMREVQRNLLHVNTL